MIGTLIAKLLKGRWGSVLPQIFKAAAEGKFGEPAKKFYWFGAGYRTLVGAAIAGVGVFLVTLCDSSGAVYPWACTVQPYVVTAGGLLVAVGLSDGGMRAPQPAGTPKAIDGTATKPE